MSTLSTQNTVEPAGTAPFETHFPRVVRSLQGSLSKAYIKLGISKIPALGVSRLLGIDKSLAWKISKFLDAADPFVAASHLPGLAGAKKFTAALRASGVSPAIIDEIEALMLELDQLGRQQSSNRTSLRAMMASLAPSGSSEASHEEFRRTAFQANSALWGVTARVKSSLSIILASDTPGMADNALIHGIEDLRRIRRDVRWPLLRRGTFGADGEPIEVPSIPLDAEGATVSRSFPLLAFSSPIVSHLDESRYSRGVMFSLPPGPVGAEGSTTAYFGDVVRAIGSIYADKDDDFAEASTRVDIPTEWFLKDVLIEKSLPFTGLPMLTHYSCLTGGDGRPGPERDAEQLACSEAVTDIGDDDRGWVNPQSSRHHEVMSWAIHTLNRSPSDFRAYRLLVRYPLIPSMYVLRMQLPPKT